VFKRAYGTSPAYAARGILPEIPERISYHPKSVSYCKMELSEQSPDYDVEQNAADNSYLKNYTVAAFAWQAVTVTVKDKKTKESRSILSGVDGVVRAGKSNMKTKTMMDSELTILNRRAVGRIRFRKDYALELSRPSRGHLDCDHCTEHPRRWDKALERRISPHDHLCRARGCAHWFTDSA